MKLLSDGQQYYNERLDEVNLISSAYKNLGTRIKKVYNAGQKKFNL